MKQDREEVRKDKKDEEVKEIVKEELKALADKKYKEFHSGLCPGIHNILGVRIPVLRKYAKDFLKRFPEVSFQVIDDEFNEEIMLKGMLIGILGKDDYETNISNIRYLVDRIDNWAVCDSFVTGLKFIKKNPEEYWQFVKGFVTKEKEFEKRFAYVVMLSYYITDPYIDEVLELLVNEKSQEYYVYMAVAWALSVCLIKYFDKTLYAMNHSKLWETTYNKAIQKACESYRITPEQKAKLRDLKRK